MASLLGPTAFLMARTVAIAGTYAVGTSLAARAGTQAAAAHQICTQLWLASSLLSDALAVAAQSLVARSLAQGDAPAARRVVGRAVGMAAALGAGMAALLAVGAPSLPRLFTSDPGALDLAGGAVWRFVVLTQPVNSMAFVFDGVLFGAGGFRYACAQMALACAPAVALMVALAGPGGAASQPPASALTGVWAGLALVMALRWGLIWLPYRARTGPFAALFPPEGSTPGHAGAAAPGAGDAGQGHKQAP